MLTRLGDALRDKSEHATFGFGARLTQPQIDALYEEDAIVARIIDRPADDLTRGGFDFKNLDGVDESKVHSMLEGLGLDDEGEPTHVLSSISDLHRWGRKCGGALMGVIVDDGKRAYEPLDMASIRRVVGFYVVDREEVTPQSVGGGRPEAYLLNTNDSLPIEDRLVHRSRFRRFVGPKIPRRRQREMSHWGVSELDRIWKRVRRYMQAHGYAESILHEAVLDVYQIKGYAEMLMREGGEADVLKLLVNLKLGQDILHGTVLDAEDKYTPVTKSAGSIPELLDRFTDALVAATNMPRSILLGLGYGGLNSGDNAGDFQAWYDSVAAEQSALATPWLNWVLELLFSSREGPTRGKVPDEWTIEWRPLWQPTAKEQADTRLVHAQADQIYWNMGAASEEEIRRARFVEGDGGEIEVESADLPDPPAPTQSPATGEVGESGSDVDGEAEA